MSQRIMTFISLTPTATADAADLADNTYPGAIQGASSTQKIHVREVFIGGQATSNSIATILLARDSQVATGAIALSSANGQADAPWGPNDSVASAAPIVIGTAATNKPRRSASHRLLVLPLNAWGGLLRWQPGPGEDPSLVGNTANVGEISLSAFTGFGGGPIGGHLVYEPD